MAVNIHTTSIFSLLEILGALPVSPTIVFTSLLHWTTCAICACDCQRRCAAGAGLVAQWITRLTTDQKILGSTPG